MNLVINLPCTDSHLNHGQHGPCNTLMFNVATDTQVGSSNPLHFMGYVAGCLIPSETKLTHLIQYQLQYSGWQWLSRVSDMGLSQPCLKMLADDLLISYNPSLLVASNASSTQSRAIEINEPK